MEESAPKRRKTSPTTNVPISDSNAPGSDESGSVRRSARQKRPSFAAPTRASLARSNPDILARRSPSRPRAQGTVETAASEPGGQDSDSDLAAAQLEAESEIGRAQEVENDTAPPSEQPRSASQLRSPARRVTGGMASRPRRTPNKPSPRPLPPPPTEEEELIDPFRGRMLRRSPDTGVLPKVVPEEPELPPTPTQRGVSDPSSVNTSPVGIHNTPSKRPRRSKALAERIKSSPLKQPPLRPPELSKEIAEPAGAKLGIAEPAPIFLPRRSKRISHAARNVPEFDPLAEKKALRDALLAEVAQLEKDSEVASRENERINQLQDSKQTPSDMSAKVEDEEALLDVLRRYTLPPEKEPPPEPMQYWLEAAMNPIAVLPFGSGGLSLPSLLSAPPDRKDEPEPPPTSHHPIPMTAEEELPYLQVFTPLTFTSSISTIKANSPESPSPTAPLLQRHAISIASSPPGLFAAKLDMTVNTKNLTIAALSIPRLEPSAVSELGPFIKRIIEGGGNNSALTRNINVVTWAMGSWLRLATRRARFWCAVERDLGSPTGLARCARTTRKGTRKKRVGRPAAPGSDDEDAGGKSEEADRFTKNDILTQLGRTSYDLDLGGVDDEDEKAPTARIQWRIEFDWTGEARSQIGLLVGVPAKWHAQDDKASLTSIPDLFDKLLQESKDPMEAVKIVVALMVGEGGK
ncbi:hypothetical protein F4780DRAFT_753376 [Xylariomycetidae sp. FL0641]|nr:hypothetical protein F4780DRAFT_753376 [Xylariomycetidae sp. FL0641]